MKKVKLLFLFILCVCMFSFGTEVKAANDTTIYVEVQEGEDIAIPLIRALELAGRRGKNLGGIHTVKVKPGEYKLGRTLHIYGNTTLDVTDVTLNYSKSSGNMMMNSTNEINKSSEAAGYGKDKNMTILGGTWVFPKNNSSCIMRFLHCSELTLKGCVITGGNSTHQVETGAIDGFYVEGCTFKDMNKSNKQGGREALQLDIPICNSVFPLAYQDGTLMKNVKITGCTFKNLPRGVGSHNTLVGGYFDNINITDNRFENIEGDAIITVNYINSKIDNNTMINCGSGVLFTHHKSGIQAVYNTIFDGKVKYKGKVVNNANTSISNNTFVMRSKSYASELCAIKTAGYNQLKQMKKKVEGHSTTIQKGNYHISGLVISNNKITTNGYGIHLMNIRDSEVSNNIIICKGSTGEYDGISIEKESYRISIDKNQVTNSRRDGIAVKAKASASSLKGNNVKSAKRYGIFIYEKSKVLGDFTSNNISSCKSNGIEVNIDCSLKNCKNNTIKYCKGYAVRMGYGVSAKIQHNNLIKNKKNYYVLHAKSVLTVAKNYGPVNIAKAKYKDKKLTLSWKSVKKATGYYIDYSTDETFKKYKTINATKNTLEIKNLKRNTTYYFRIRAYGKAEKMIVYGEYGKNKKVKIK